MFDLKDLNSWRVLGSTPVKFKNAEPRKVRLEVLAEDEAKLYVKQANGPVYIGTFDGYDVVTFYANGPYELSAKGGPVKVRSPEFDGPNAVEVPDAVSFTRIVTRRQRNPELELITRKMQENMERRFAQLANDVQLRENARERQRQAEAASLAAAEDDDGDDGQEGESEADA